MHFVVGFEKLHKLLHLILLVSLAIVMIYRPVNSRNCNGAVRTIQLYSEFTKGHVRIEKKKVTASSSIDYTNHILQMITIDRHYFLLYDPNAKMFVCWNRNYTNLVAKRNPKNLTLCKFEEKTSIKRPSGLTRYTSTYYKSNRLREVELRFNRAGTFAFPRLIKRCLERRKRQKIPTREHLRHYYKLDFDAVSNVDTLNMTEDGRRAYIQLSKYCADPDFIVRKDSIDCSLGYSNFCEQMKRIHQRHSIAQEVQKLCNL